jgi:Acetyltransferase (GNAT) family
MTNTGKRNWPFSDLALSRRLERTEGRGCAEFVAARARLFPQHGAEWIEVGGTYAMFDGINSPVTQTFGLGMFEPVTGADLDLIEEFFQLRGAPVFHEVSPLADAALPPMLNERRYQPFEFTSVMYRPIESGIHYAELTNERVQVRLIDDEEQEIWTETAARGWSEYAGLGDFLADVGKITSNRPDATLFLAELEGRPIAAGALSICDGVMLLAGASTIPEARKQGAQLALLDSRLRYGVEQGCDIAMMCAQPGSASQRNAERQGFRIAYTRIKWRLDKENA